MLTASFDGDMMPSVSERGELRNGEWRASSSGNRIREYFQRPFLTQKSKEGTDEERRWEKEEPKAEQGGRRTRVLDP